MKLKSTFAVFVSFFAVGSVLAQDLGPQIRKLEDGVYVYVGKNFNSNCGIVLTREGVVLIDSGHNPTDSRAILEAVKKLTPLSVRFLICALASGVSPSASRSSRRRRRRCARRSRAIASSRRTSSTTRR